jgi:Flp pilus assembly protein TadG
MVGDGIVTPGTGFLTRLARSKRAATLPMMAAAVIPLVGMLGGGLDLSRLYIVQTRLQHACDAGALAGRRTMGGGIWTQSSNLPQRTAVQFFDSNIEGNAFGATVGRPTYTESAGRVTGTATATVPMTLMRVFGYTEMTLTANCDAEMRLPNTDVMFVLDTTGSMDETLPGDSRTKINALRFAVKCFYEEVARLDTNADCTPGTPGPTGGTGSGTQIRFGFVPYATNVNVGRLLPTSYIANEWSYQSRERIQNGWDVDTDDGNWPSSGSSSPSWNSSSWTTHSSQANRTENQCNNTPIPDNTTTYGPVSSSTSSSTSGQTTTTTTVSTRVATRTEYRRRWGVTDTSGNERDCVIQTRTRTRTETKTDTEVRSPRFTWRYKQIEHDISGLRTGTTWNAGVSLPLGTDGAMTTVNWPGCIEERPTVRQATYWPIPADAADLDIDLVPSSTAGTKWGAALPGAVYRRTSGGSRTRADVLNDGNFPNAGNDCPSQARKLQAWPNASGIGGFQTYVDGLTTGGNTYHDIGLIWGARFISPTGIFASENAQTSGGGEIERHMIFMTDGVACTGVDNYLAYGIQWWDRRQTNDSVAPTDSGSPCVADTGTLTAQVNARFTAVCQAVQNKNITLWVIYFGTTDATTVNRMTACATPGRFYYANNSAALITAFRSIAAQISQLRLTS